MGSLLLSVIAALVVAFALTSPAQAAGEFCVNQQVNNVQKCWGPPQSVEVVYGVGHSTGLCVGEDTVQGQCSPAGQMALLRVARGTHQPWVTGTASALTTFNATSY
jgi:hypothetical protein